MGTDVSILFLQGEKTLLLPNGDFVSGTLPNGIEIVPTMMYYCQKTKEGKIMNQQEELTMKQRIERYLALMDENNPVDKKKLQLILKLIDRVYVGRRIW